MVGFYTTHNQYPSVLNQQAFYKSLTPPLIFHFYLPPVFLIYSCLAITISVAKLRIFLNFLFAVPCKEFEFNESPTGQCLKSWLFVSIPYFQVDFISLSLFVFPSLYQDGQPQKVRELPLLPFRESVMGVCECLERQLKSQCPEFVPGHFH